MKKAGDLVQSISTTQTGQKTSTTISDQDAKLLNRVFGRLCAIKPAWSVNIKDQETIDTIRQEWMKGLIEAKINDDKQLKRGLSQARANPSPFLPSVGQFIEWCRPNEHIEHKRRREADRAWRENKAKMLEKKPNPEAAEKGINDLYELLEKKRPEGE